MAMKNNLSNILKSFILFYGISLLSIYECNAQENGIYELNNSNQFYRVSAAKSKGTNTRAEFYNLSQKLHPTVYLGENRLKNKYGDGNIVKVNIDDISSLNLVTQDRLNYNNVELITITLKSLSDLYDPISLPSENGLTELKYLYIKCLFECSNEQIKGFVKNISNSKIRVFYTSEKPS